MWVIGSAPCDGSPCCLKARVGRWSRYSLRLIYMISALTAPTTRRSCLGATWHCSRSYGRSVPRMPSHATPHNSPLDAPRLVNEQPHPPIADLFAAQFSHCCLRVIREAEDSIAPHLRRTLVRDKSMTAGG